MAKGGRVDRHADVTQNAMILYSSFGRMYSNKNANQGVRAIY